LLAPCVGVGGLSPALRVILAEIIKWSSRWHESLNELTWKVPKSRVEIAKLATKSMPIVPV
jgi:hypothetical protein